MNDKNLDFYNNIGIDPFKLLAEVGGFDSYKDMELVFPYIKNYTSIIELGAGYGRCIEFLLKNKFKGKIVAVEQSPVLAAHLRDNFFSQVEIIEEDIKKLALRERIDVALWMWSGFIDFSREEQMEMIRKVKSFLNPNGKIILDLPRPGVQTIAQHTDPKHLSFESPFGNLQCYLPDYDDMKEYANNAGYVSLEKIDYLTSTDKERTVYIIS